MKNHSALTAYGLKWNPFIPDIPTEGLVTTPRISSFCHRVESLVLDGGFAIVTGEPGTGKSVVMRLLEDRLSAVRDLVVCPLSRPQSSVSDFYRELGSHFGTTFTITNRWGGYKALREKWLAHIDATGLKPVILVDEAQEMPTATMVELRHLAAMAFDSRTILTVVLGGDNRLIDRFREAELVALGTRIRTRYVAEPSTREELAELLHERIERAGNPAIMTKELIYTLADHSAGNPRVMLNAADELFSRAAERQQKQLDEKLFLEIFQRRDEKRLRKERAR